MAIGAIHFPGVQLDYQAYIWTPIPMWNSNDLS